MEPGQTAKKETGREQVGQEDGNLQSSSQKGFSPPVFSLGQKEQFLSHSPGPNGVYRQASFSESFWEMHLWQRKGSPEPTSLVTRK